MKSNNPMHNPKIKAKWMKLMREKVWDNKERNRKISETQIGKKLTPEHIEKLKMSHLGNRNSEISKIKNSIKQTELMKDPLNREKRRVARQKQILRNGGGPAIGRNEKELLDILQSFVGYKIHRQHSIKGYWVDGYIPELNLVVEIDERPKTNDRDKRREQEIREALKCKFLRINDYGRIKNGIN